MNTSIKNHKRLIRGICFFILAAALPLLSELILCRIFSVRFSITRASLYFFISMLIFFALPVSPFFKIKLNDKNRIKNALIAFTLIITVVLSVIPMTLNPIWNGEIPDHRAEYEEAANAYLDGHLYIETEEIPQALKNMPNPYDYEARKKIGIGVEPTLWDRAYYKGHLYLYFGVFPVLTLFMPYKAITGKPLTTWKATAIFEILSITGFFALFYFLAKKNFKDMRLSTYLFLSAALCFCSFWYLSIFPALYCTAISAGLALEIWSIYFLSRAFLSSSSKKNAFIFLGALSGALVFSARPTVALSSLIFLPFFISVLFKGLKKKPVQDKKRTAAMQLSLIAVPYLFVAISLMLYNFIRFENPFEFGQSYQLTVADQHNYLSGGGINSMNIIKGFFILIFDFGKKLFTASGKKFPFISRMPVFSLFPILFIGLFTIPFSLKAQKKEPLRLIHTPSVIAPFIIFLSGCIASPVPLMRYTADFTFLFALAAFTGVLFILKRLDKKDIRHSDAFQISLCILSICVFITVFLLQFTKGDSSLADIFPKEITRISNTFMYK